ncbi:endoribonuclease dicer [Plakobranchus ocellatus]|uniref:Endoribonuclease dicer n=1 Tax=Plakobranchus ocellatus TaxID=259542 RepID=A0AAV4DCH3_9GAST|nr:endoribonuclease dicer [Plakobranchus ocellatus]
MATNSSVGRKGSRYHRFDNIPTKTFTPMTYQIQLLDAALQKNTLLCLGCASSKIFLALMVAKEMSSAIRPSLKDGGKRTFYLTDSEEEAEAVSSTLPHHTDLKIGCCISTSSHAPQEGEDIGQGQESSLPPTDLSTWQQFVENNNIVVCTGAKFLAALKDNLVQLNDANLLIFDDCHRAVEREECDKPHPYADIVSLVKQMDTAGHVKPHILGVTAAIAGTDCSDPEQLRATISAMECAMHAQAQTSMLILTERFGCRPHQQVVCCDLDDVDPGGISEKQAELQQALEGILLRDYHFFLDCQEQLIKQAGGKDPGETPRQVLEQCLTILSVLGPWCCSSVGEYFHMQLEKIAKLERCDIHKRCLRCVMTTLRVLARTFERDFDPEYFVDQFLAYTTPKVRALVNSLRKFKPEVDFIIISNSSDENGGDDGELSDLSDEGDEDEEDDDSMSGSDEEDGHDKRGSPSSSKPVHIAVKRTADGGMERVTGFFEEEKNLCGIVFVQNRYIAFGLSKVIEEVCSWDEDLCFVKSCHITGQGLRGSGSAAGGTGKQHRSSRACKRQEEALRKFRTQEVNLVIATPELEEGIDIPKCNLVVRFDPPKDYRSYTLSKGRARARDASYIILLDEDSYEGFQTRLEIFKGIEQVLLGDVKMEPLLKKREEDGDTEDSDEEESCDSEDLEVHDVLPAYKTMPFSPKSPHVTMQGAIALVNRYCARLPSDAFTHLTPHCRLERRDGQYVAFLRLPINSPLKQELQGPAMRTKKLAKMAVALKMCEILHEKGKHKVSCNSSDLFEEIMKCT